MTLMVDPDGDPSTWPAALRDAATRFVRDATPDPDDRVSDLLNGRPLRAYHATRLLPHEIEDVRANGLRMLTESLVERRLSEALAYGHISREVHDQLTERQVFSESSPVHDQVPSRDNKVCAVVGQAALNPWGLSWPLETWGGEGIYWAAGDLKHRLRGIGSPAIVVLDLDLSAEARVFTAGPVMAVFAARAQSDAESTDAEIHWHAPIPADSVVDLWRPGDASYDVLSGLPAE